MRLPTWLSRLARRLLLRPPVSVIDFAGRDHAVIESGGLLAEVPLRDLSATP